MRHRTDPGALLAGLFFLAVGLTFMVMGLEGGHPDWIVLGPPMAIGFALVLLVRVFTRSRRRD